MAAGHTFEQVASWRGGILPARCSTFPHQFPHRTASPPAPIPRNRYLRATGGDVKHAAKRIGETLAWRREEQPEHMACTACHTNSKSHYMQVGGWAAADGHCSGWGG